MLNFFNVSSIAHSDESGIRNLAFGVWKCYGDWRNVVKASWNKAFFHFFAKFLVYLMIFQNGF